MAGEHAFSERKAAENPISFVPRMHVPRTAFALQDRAESWTAWALAPTMWELLAFSAFHCLMINGTSLSPALANLPKVTTQP